MPEGIPQVMLYEFDTRVDATGDPVVLVAVGKLPGEVAEVVPAAPAGSVPVPVAAGVGVVDMNEMVSVAEERSATVRLHEQE
jgi:hypothetical protein